LTWGPRSKVASISGKLGSDHNKGQEQKLSPKEVLENLMNSLTTDLSFGVGVGVGFLTLTLFTLIVVTQTSNPEQHLELQIPLLCTKVVSTQKGWPPTWTLGI